MVESVEMSIEKLIEMSIKMSIKKVEIFIKL